MAIAIKRARSVAEIAADIADLLTDFDDFSAMIAPTLLGMTKPNIPKETWKPVGKVLSQLAGKLVAQRNSGAGDATIEKSAPPLRGVATDGRDAAIKLGRSNDQQRDVDAPQNPSSVEGGSTGETEVALAPQRDAGRAFIALQLKSARPVHCLVSSACSAAR